MGKLASSRVYLYRIQTRQKDDGQLYDNEKDAIVA